MKYKLFEKRYFTFFISAMALVFLLVSLSSCKFFDFDSSKSKNIDSNPCTLVITPRFGNESLNGLKSSRSAFPDFSSISYSDYTFKVTSSVLDDDVTGTYDSAAGNISFSIQITKIANTFKIRCKFAFEFHTIPSI